MFCGILLVALTQKKGFLVIVNYNQKAMLASVSYDLRTYVSYASVSGNTVNSVSMILILALKTLEQLITV